MKEMSRASEIYMYQQVITTLREAYNRSAEERDKGEKTRWKLEERQYFLSLLQQEGKKSLLEIGAGTGQDSKFFQDNGLTVVSTDLTPEMVKRCQEKGLTAYVMDFLHLDFPESSFDAVYALNCLLHVPTKDLPKVLQTIWKILRPTGLFYMGQYGGVEREGVWPNDNQEPKRFFSFHTDEHMQNIVTAFFELVYFKPILVEENRSDGDDNFHFQSMILRRSL